MLDLRGTRSQADAVFRWLAIGAAAMVLLVLGMIALVMTNRAGPVFKAMGFDFLTTTRWSPADALYGALPFLWGTLYTSLIAIAIALPVSLGVAMFVTQVAPMKWRRPLIYVLDLLAVIPSVVFGLWGILVLGPHLGRSFLTAGIILAIMITPIITSLSREVIETTPKGEKEAALALGATHWEMIWGAVWPHSKGGVVGAVMLGLGRAMGETIAAALVIGSALGQITVNIMAPGNSMPAVIANEWGEADALHKSALIALAVVLFVITIAVNLVATSIVRRSMARNRGKSS
ncbi:MAG TPA: phosphate ABC transporter permease subunit PstC [Kofleriaceae bacterium]|jgi:phosphate transport system permease protein